MKALFAVVSTCVLLSAVGIEAQPFGVVMFTNLSSSRVTNGLLMDVVRGTNPPLRASLYVAADGVTNESDFTATGDSVLVAGPGMGAGGYGGRPHRLGRGAADLGDVNR